MSVGKDRVFELAAIEELKAEYENLFRVAMEMTIRVESEIGRVLSLIEQVPIEARSNMLYSNLSNLNLEKDIFQHLLDKLQRDSERLLGDLPSLDKKASENLRELNKVTRELISLFKEYQGLLNSSFATQDVQGFTKALSKMRLKNGIAMDKVDKKLKEIAEVSKGLVVESVKYSKDPVNLATGNFALEKEDLSIQGEYPLVFKRTYNAIDDYQGVLGKNWVHSFEVSVIEKDEQVKIMLEDGHMMYFLHLQENQYISRLNPGKLLLKEEKGYLLTTEDQETYKFNRNGQLIEKVLENGTYLRLNYDNNRLKKVTSKNASLRFNYNGEGLLISITDNAERKVLFFYEGNHLTAVMAPNESKLRYKYNEKGQLISSTNQRNIDLVQNEYDGLSRTIKQVFPDGGTMMYAYDDDNNSITITEQNGNRITYYRDEQYRNTKVIYSDGEEITTFNEQNKITSHTDKKGNKTEYSYDNRGNMVRIVNPLGEDITIQYDERNHPIQIEQANGAIYKLLYKDGNLISIQNPLNQKSQILYDEQNRPVQVVQLDGSVFKFSYDAHGNLSAITYPNSGTMEYEYNALNRVIQSKNPKGAITKFEYDEVGNIVKVINDEGNSREYTYNAINKITSIKDFDDTIIKQEYNKLGKVSKITDQSGNITEYAYDLMWNISKITLANDAETVYWYNKLNQLEKVQNALGNTTIYQYDENNNVTEIISPTGEKTEIVYDSLNRRNMIIDEKGIATCYSYNNLGKIQSIIDGDGNEVFFEYDLLGQLIKQVDPMGHTTQFTYTELGNIETITNANGGITRYSYYPGGNLKEIFYPGGEKETYAYDLNDNVVEKTLGDVSKTIFTYDPLDRLTSITNPMEKNRHFTYDPCDRIIAVKDEEGNITEYDYTPTGDLCSVKDALGNITIYDYDQIGNLTKIQQYEKIDKELGQVSQLNRMTDYQYDLLGNLIKTTDALGNVETYAYDENNRLIHRIDKDGYQTSMVYDERSHLKEINYDDGRQVRFQYNDLRRLVEIEDWLGKTKIDVDALGRLESVTTPDGNTVNYQWDALNNLTGRTYPNGKEVQYTYDPSNKLTSIETENQIYSYHYDTVGRLIQKEFPNRVRTNYRYNDAHRLVAMIHENEEETLERYLYEYNGVGNKTKVKKERKDFIEDSGEYTYTYDPLNRLTKVIKEGHCLRNYEYDTFGNRIKKESQGQETLYQYNELNQLVQQQQQGKVTTFNYDKRGNRIQEITNGELSRAFTFDATNMMSKVINNNGEETLYTYNGLRNRVGQKVYKNNESLQNIQYTLDLAKPYNNVLILEKNQVEETYLWDEELLSRNDREYYLLDDLGSPLRAINPLGNTTETYGYDEFGIPLMNQQSSQPFGFTGYQQDEISGLNYAQARYYDAEQGRFASEDNIKGNIYTPQTLNPYVYCWNQPKDYVDKDGNAGILTAIGIATLIGVGVGITSQGVSDIFVGVTTGEWEMSSWETYAGAAAGGGLGGGLSVFTLNPVATTAIASGFSTFTGQGLEEYNGKENRGWEAIGFNTFVSSLIGGFVGFLPLPKLEIQGVNAGRNSFNAVYKSGITKLVNGTAKKMSFKVMAKGLTVEMFEEFQLNFLLSKILETGFEKTDGIYERGKEVYRELNEIFRNSKEMRELYLNRGLFDTGDIECLE